jgi:hypothetical protein
MKASLESKAIKRSERANKKSRPTAVSSKKRQKKVASLKQTKKSYRKNLKKQLDPFSSEEDTNINDKNICDDNGENHIETYCEKCFMREEFRKSGELSYRFTGCGIWAQPECSGWDFRMLLFVTCVREEIQNENRHKVSEDCPS